jgi:ribonuclease HI
MSEIIKKQSISYYVVNKGLIPGIYTSWSECKKQVVGFTNPIYKKFDNKKDAIAFHNLEIDFNKTVKIEKEIKEIKEELQFKNITYLFCDGSAIHKNYKSIKCSFGLYIINPFENNTINNKESNELKDFKNGVSVSQFISETGTNNLAELSSVLYGLNYIEKNNINKSCFVCDSKYAINCITVWSHNWKKNNWMTSKKTKVENLEIIQEILNIYEKLLKNNFEIEFKHVNSHQTKPKNTENTENTQNNSFEYFLWFGNDMADKNANI